MAAPRVEHHLVVLHLPLLLAVDLVQRLPQVPLPLPLPVRRPRLGVLAQTVQLPLADREFVTSLFFEFTNNSCRSSGPASSTGSSAGSSQTPGNNGDSAATSLRVGAATGLIGLLTAVVLA
ncbi:MAG TPA: hypothetical protein VGO47_01975 [Chlamydiales bacterium]|nr:hypothetical protein [Chlamydiales bacterium]